MRVTSHRIADVGGYPALILELEPGGRAELGHDQQKAAILDAGLVYLGPAFEGLLPPAEYRIPGQPGAPAQVLEGYTADPEIVRLYREYLDSIA